MMDHYQSQSWVDYARGLVSEPERTNMEGHLGSCSPCRESADAFERLAATTLSPDPPDEIVDRARAIFAHPHPGVTREIRLEPEPMRPRLLYDSATVPITSGLRRAGGGTRRMLFEVGRYFLDVDLALRPGVAPATSQLVVVGQLVDREDPGRPLPGLGVSLHDPADAPLARSTSNALGEFELVCESEVPALRLAVPVNGDDRIEVELPTLSEDDGGGPLEAL